MALAPEEEAHRKNWIGIMVGQVIARLEEHFLDAPIDVELVRKFVTKKYDGAIKEKGV